MEARGIQCVVVIFCMTAIPTIAQDILDAPDNLTVFLDQLAVFSCEANGDTSTWRVNGSLLGELTHEQRSTLEVSVTNIGSGVTLEQLTIPARAEYNGTQFQCVTFNVGSPSKESETATLYIQGPLSAVLDLNTSSYGTSINVSWTAPWSLGVTGVDPDIWYSVIIYNVTDMNNISTIHCTNCINITYTKYEFTPDYVGCCHVYNFSVIPFNGAGKGESQTVTFRNRQILISITRLDIKGSCIGTDSTFEINTCGIIESVCVFYGVLGLSKMTNASIVNGHNVSFSLPTNNIFSLVFEIFTTVGSIVSTYDNLSTYDVQSLSVEEGAGGVVLTGEFMEGSHAVGCLVTFEGHQSEPDTFKSLHRERSEKRVSATITITSNTYTVYGYDLEEDCLPNTQPGIFIKNVLINSDAVSVLEKSSVVLKSANISRDGQRIIIDCEFQHSFQETSCVLVYREHSSRGLTVIAFPRIVNFPVSITVDNPEDHTFALFGRSDMMEEEPIVSVKFYTKALANLTIPDSEDKTETNKAGTNLSQVQVVVISIGTGLIFLLVLGSALTVMVVIRQRCKRKSMKHSTGEAVVHANNPVYEEVIPPQAKIFSGITTEHNEAYSTTVCQTQTIPTPRCKF